MRLMDKGLVADEKVADQIDLIEADREGLHIHYKDGKVEFYAWQNHRFEEAANPDPPLCDPAKRRKPTPTLKDFF